MSTPNPSPQFSPRTLDARDALPTGDGPEPSAGGSAAQSRMSYKYQRLREKLRQAVTTGELTGKLPGERALAKRFHVNAKTLSKALTDLAAEGVLDRSIGRGTYVKGTAPPAATPGRWLVLCDAVQGGRHDNDACLVDQFRQGNPDLQIATSASVAEMRPSFLSGFGAVIDVASDTPEAFLRDLVVRNMPVVAVNREPKTYSTHAVLVDAALGASRIARDLLLAGHRRLGVVERPGSNTVSHAVRQAATRYDRGAAVDTFSPAEMEQGRGIAAAVESGVTALVCDSVRSAEQVKAGLERKGHEVPGALSLAAVGCVCGGPDKCPCSGYFVDCEPLAEAVIGLLRDNPPSRPATLWLAGEFIDRGTLAPAAIPEGHARPSVFRFGDAVA